MLPTREENSTSNQMSSFNRYADGKSMLHKETFLNKLSKWTLFLSPLIFFLICFIFLIAVISISYVHQSSNIESAESTLRALARNLQQNPIIDIKSTDSTAATAKCDDLYNKEILYIWSGINSGCLCKDGSVHSWAYCQFKGECTWVDSFDPQNFEIWDTKFVCVKRLQTDDWRLVSPPRVGETAPDSCPSGYTVAADTNILCLKNGLTNKVITSVVVNDAGGLDLRSKKFQLKTDTNKEWLVDLVVSKFGVPCLDPKLRPQPMTSFPLLKIKEQGCGDIFGQENAYTSLMTDRSQKDFYIDNKIYENIIKNLPFSSDFINENDKFNLYSESRALIETSKVCVHIDPVELDFSSNSVSHLLDSVQRFSIVCLILTIIGLFATFGQYFCRNIKIMKRYPCQGNIVPYFIFLLVLVVAVLLIIQASLIWDRSTSLANEDSLHEYFEKLLTNNCFKIPGHKKAAEILAEFFRDSSLPIYGLVSFLAIWSMVWIVIFTVCYLVRRFVYQDLVFTKPY